MRKEEPPIHASKTLLKKISLRFGKKHGEDEGQSKNTTMVAWWHGGMVMHHF